MQSLIQILKSGYAYNRTKDDGSLEQVLVAPNKYMISAAKELERVYAAYNFTTTALDHERYITQQLYMDCENYRRTIKELEGAIRTISDSTNNSTCSSTEQNVADS